METTKVNSEAKKSEINSLKGTMFSVLMVGAFIGLLFVGIFWLYMSRV